MPSFYRMNYYQGSGLWWCMYIWCCGALVTQIDSECGKTTATFIDTNPTGTGRFYSYESEVHKQMYIHTGCILQYDPVFRMNDICGWDVDVEVPYVISTRIQYKVILVIW